MPRNPTERTVRVGLGQQLVIPGDRDGNVARAIDMIRGAAEAGAEYVVLPECLDVGWTHPVPHEDVEELPGPTSDALGAAAREHGIVVVAGLTERRGGDRHNAAVVLDRDGDIVHLHRKIHEVDIARGLYTAGTSLGVVDVAGLRVGVTICADNLIEAIDLGRAVGRMGADLLLSPSSWAVRPGRDPERDPYGAGWEEPYRLLAEEFGMAVVGVSNVGPVRGGAWDGWSCIGRSLAVGADGRIAHTGAYGADAEELGVVDLLLG